MSKHVIHDDGTSPLILYIYRKKHPQTPKPKRAQAKRSVLPSSSAQAMTTTTRSDRPGTHPHISEGMKRWWKNRKRAGK